MVTKTDAKNVEIDWDRIYKITEVPRTYLVKDEKGREFFKMYKPSEALRIFKTKGWTGSIISTIRREQ